MLDFKKPITTRKGSEVKFYYFYPDRIHGAYEYKGDWYIYQWDINGQCGTEPSSIDLINVEEPEQQLA